MSVFSALFDSRVQSFEQAFRVKDITTAEMKSAIGEWYGLYYQREPDQKEDPCQRIPYTVVNKLTKTVFSEYSAATGKQSAKADFIKKVLSGLELCRREAMQQALIGGECFLKPVFGPLGVSFSVIRRNACRVLERDELGAVTDLGTQEVTEGNGFIYTMLERRTVSPDGYLTIYSSLYRSDSREHLGIAVPLGTLEKYATLVPENRLPQRVRSIGLISLKTPMENCVDGSKDGVSIYAAAAGLIHLINLNEAQINGEFERGESRIIVSSDLMEKDGKGKRKLSGHIFTGLDDDPENVGVTIFSPAFREQSFLARKTEYLRNVESMIGLKRGILSDVEATERTATEITSSAGDYNLTIVDFQRMWECGVREAVRVCDVLGQMYRYCDSTSVDPDQDVSIGWGNGILYDEDKTWADYMGMVAAGMIRPEIALAWKFNIPWETAKDLMKIREKYMPELDAMLGGD